MMNNESDLISQAKAGDYHANREMRDAEYPVAVLCFIPQSASRMAHSVGIFIDPINENLFEMGGNPLDSYAVG